MELRRVAQALNDLLRDRAEAEESLQEAQRRVEAIDRLVNGYFEVYPDLRAERLIPEVSSGHPGTQEALLAVLSDEEQRNRYWTVSAIIAALEARSWMPLESKDPGAAVRAALARLPASHPDLVYKGTGEHGRLVYFYRHPDMPSPRFHGGEGDRPSGLLPVDVVTNPSQQFLAATSRSGAEEVEEAPR